MAILYAMAADTVGMTVRDHVEGIIAPRYQNTATPSPPVMSHDNGFEENVPVGLIADIVRLIISNTRPAAIGPATMNTAIQRIRDGATGLGCAHIAERPGPFTEA